MKKLGKRGYSLVEIVAVIAILAIVCAFAIPSLISFQKTLKLKELDDSAKSIFMAAQNNLTSLYLSGKSDSLNGTKCIPGSSLVAYDTDPIEAMLAEAVYLSNGDTTMPTLLPEASIEGVLQNHTYVVEFNPNTGAVIGVFYSENPWSYDYDVNRDFQSRKDLMLGYYGGSDVNRPEIGQLPIPEVTLINSEELTLQVRIPATAFDGSGKLIFSIGADAAGREVFYTFTGVDQNETVTVVLDTLLPGSLSQTADSSHSEVLINTETIGNAFSGWHFPGITVGDNFSLKVRFEHEPADTGKTLLPQECTVTGNSLFASRGGNDIQVAYGRHLQNLNLLPSLSDSNTYRIKQTRSIDWGSYYTDAKDRDFTALSPSAFGSYDGQEFIIKGLEIVGTTDPVIGGPHGGLFARLYDSQTLQNIRLVNPKVQEANASGALVGNMSGGTIINCGAYLEDNDSGAINTDFYNRYTIQAINAAGGLVGYANGGTITSSFASVKVVGQEGTIGDWSGRAGGLVGTTNDSVEIRNCYAGGFTQDGVYTPDSVNVIGSYAGGLIGDKKSGVVSDCYSTCSVSGTASQGVLLGSGDISTDTNAASCYATGILFGSGSEHENSQPFGEPTPQANPTVETHPYDASYYVVDAIHAFPYQPCTYNEVPIPHYGDWMVKSAQLDPSLLAYYEKYDDGTYGFYAMQDTISDTTHTFTGYGEVSFGSKGLDETDTKAVVEDGYALLSQENTLASAGTLHLTGSGILTLSNSVDTIGLTVDGETKTYYAYPIQDINDIAVASDDGYFHHIYLKKESDTLSMANFYINPHFAKDAYTGTQTDSGDLSNPPDQPVASSIRTARQLMNLEKYPADYSYQQEHTIDFEKYTGYDTLHVPMFAGDTAFAGSYNGNEKPIKNLQISSGGNYVGLLGRVSGATLTDMRLVDTKVNATASAGSAGTLAGSVEAGSTITGCGAFVSSSSTYDTHTVTAVGTVGGLIGTASQTGSGSEGISITDSFASVKVTGGIAGGFVGNADGNKVTISSCYSGGHTINGGKYVVTMSTGYDQEPIVITSRNIIGSKIAGGFAGTISQHGQATIKNCYSTCSVTLQSMPSTAGELPMGVFVGNDHGYSVTSCYAIGVAIGVKNGQTTVSAGEATTSDFETSSPQDAIPYDTQLMAKDNYYLYERPTGISVPHYGDWPVSSDDVFGAFYWEKEGENYRFYTAGWDTKFDNTTYSSTTHFSNLCNEYDAVPITDYGYGYFYIPANEEEESGFTVNGTPQELERALYVYQSEYTSSNNSYTTDFVNDFKSFLRSNVQGDFNDSRKYCLYAYDGKKLIEIRNENTSSGSGNDSMDEAIQMEISLKPTTSVNARAYTLRAAFNPDFAAAIQVNVNIPVTVDGAETSREVANGDLTDLGKVENLAYQIRTIQQLQNINQSRYLTHVSQVLNNPTYRYFKQTHDIDGSETTTFRPIGQYYTATSYNSLVFSSKYDGNSYRILNLSISGKTDERFVGLFGVVAKATIKNVTMYCSTPDQPSQIILNYAGTQISSWQQKGYGYGAGALIGVALYGSSTDESGAIQNCAVANYEIINRGSASGADKEDQNNIFGIALGGLVGWCNLDVQNCSAVATIRNNTQYWGNSDNLVRMGGLVGSGQVRITNCYVGGEIVSSHYWTGKRREYAAGIISHNEIVSLYGLTQSSGEGVVLRNCYSYCEVPYIHDVYDNLYGSLSYALLCRAWTGTPQYTIENCYFYEKAVDSRIIAQNETITDWGNSNFGYVETPYGLEQTSLTLTQLENKETIGSSGKTLTQLLNNTGINWGQASVTYTKSLQREQYNYPMPTSVTNAMYGDWYYTHHGVWPVEVRPEQGVFYWEKLQKEIPGENGAEATTETSYGFYVVRMDSDGTLHTFDTLCKDTGDGHNVVDYGYGYLRRGTTNLTPINSGNFPTTSYIGDTQFAEAFQKAANGEFPSSMYVDYTYTCYSHTELAAKQDVSTGTIDWNFYPITVDGESYAMSATINPDFAAAASITVYGDTMGNDGTSEENAYQIRSVEQLQNMGKTYYLNTPLYFRQTHDIDGSTFVAEVTENGTTVITPLFRPIGTADHPFAGTFYGGLEQELTDGTTETVSYAIRDLSIEGTKDEQYVGLFGVVQDATLWGITMESTAAPATEESGDGTEATPSPAFVSLSYEKPDDVTNAVDCGVGGLVGWAKSRTDGQTTTIDNCHVKNYLITSENVTGESVTVYAGEIAGKQGDDGTVTGIIAENCTSEGTVVRSKEDEEEPEPTP